jgi:hypothetical protein
MNLCHGSRSFSAGKWLALVLFAASLLQFGSAAAQPGSHPADLDPAAPDQWQPLGADRPGPGHAGEPWRIPPAPPLQSPGVSNPFHSTPFAQEGPQPLPQDRDVPAAPPQGAGFVALLNIAEEKKALLKALTVEQRYAPIYRLSLNVARGDILRIRGQVEITNDTKVVAKGFLRLVVDGQQLGEAVIQNCVPLGAHHMPMYADARYVAVDDRQVVIEAQYGILPAFRRNKDNPWVKIEDGYGQLVVEHYRAFPSWRSAARAGGLALVKWAVDRERKAETFGAVRFQPSTVHGVQLMAQTGDLIRLQGQSTSLWRPDKQAVINNMEMHGLGIRVNNELLSPWATENTPWDVHNVPLWIDAVHRPAAAGRYDYTLNMHGLGTGDHVLPNAGHLMALLFRPLRETSLRTLSLREARTVAGNPAHDAMTANAGGKTLLEYPLQLQRGDVVRFTGNLQLEYPAGFDLGISCVARTELVGPTGEVVDTSAVATKYITYPLQHVPLRTEQLFQAREDGRYTLRLVVSCSRESANPRVTILGRSTQLLIEHYGSVQ